MTTQLLSERVAVLGAIDPSDQTASTTTSGWISLAKFHRVMAVVMAGNLTGTANAKIQQASDSSGTGAKDITGKEITELSATDDNKQAVINVHADELDLADGFDHVQLSITTAGGTANVAAGLVLGGDARFAPATDNDHADVAEVVN